jgi:hypothetical protein
MLDMIIDIDLMVLELNRMCTFLIEITDTFRNSEVMAIIFLKFLNNKIMAMAMAMDIHIMADFLLIIL